VSASENLLDKKTANVRKAINSTSCLEYLDDSNRQIIKELQDNPRISQARVAEKVGLSQSLVSIRLAKLVESGMVRNSIGINYGKLGLKMARVDLAVKDPYLIMQWAKKCPLCVNASKAIGRSNLSLFLVFEDLENLTWIVEKHLWKLDGIMDCNYSFINSWIFGDDICSSLDLAIERKVVPPCGELPFCPQCPKNPNYEGKVWAGNTDLESIEN
jgi:DNA-binding Lrp family transcriptional regulator